MYVYFTSDLPHTANHARMLIRSLSHVPATVPGDVVPRVGDEFLLYPFFQDDPAAIGSLRVNGR